MLGLICCICRSPAGRFKQHWNRDKGFGVCPRCAREELARGAPMKFLYGTPGVNYSMG